MQDYLHRHRPTIKGVVGASNPAYHAGNNLTTDNASCRLPRPARGAFAAPSAERASFNDTSSRARWHANTKDLSRGLETIRYPESRPHHALFEIGFPLIFINYSVLPSKDLC